jgi:hypothetical protein
VTPDLGAARPDFLDRALMVEFSGIRPEMRRDEGRFWGELEAKRPKILGALLQAATMGLRNLPHVNLERTPRLADFAVWVIACEKGLGMRPGEAITAFQASRTEARDIALEASPLYQPLARLASEGFTGTIAELRARLNSMVGNALMCSSQWPKTPNLLGTALRRMATNIREAGIELQFSRPDHSGRRIVSVRATAKATKSSSASSAVPQAKIAPV